MVKRGPEIDSVKELVVFLEKAGRKNGAPIWKAVAEKICAPRRSRVEVNLGRLARVAPKGATVVVPGKVLGAGELPHKLDVACLSSAKGVKEKVAKAGGRLTGIRELAEANPKGSGVLIIV